MVRKNFLPILQLLVLVSSISSQAMNNQIATSQNNNLILQSIVMNNNYEDGTEFINKMCSAAQSLNNYSSSYRMIVYKDHPPVIEAGVFAFKKPHLMQVEVQEGPKRGAVAVLAEDGRVHGHLGGPLKFFRAAVSPDSELVRAANNFPMVGTDFYSLASYLRNMLHEGDLSRVSKEPLQTSKTAGAAYVLDMYSSQMGKDLLLKRIYTDPSTLRPIYWEDYIDGKIWSESTWHDIKTNVEFPENYFKP